MNDELIPETSREAVDLLRKVLAQAENGEILEVHIMAKTVGNELEYLCSGMENAYETAGYFFRSAYRIMEQAGKTE